MKDSRSGKLAVITVIAAVVAAATTVAILLVRAKAKKKAWYERAAFDYDVDDCDYLDDCDGDCAACDGKDSTEE